MRIVSLPTSLVSLVLLVCCNDIYIMWCLWSEVPSFFFISQMQVHKYKLYWFLQSPIQKCEYVFFNVILAKRSYLLWRYVGRWVQWYFPVADPYTHRYISGQSFTTLTAWSTVPRWPVLGDVGYLWRHLWLHKQSTILVLVYMYMPLLCLVVYLKGWNS